MLQTESCGGLGSDNFVTLANTFREEFNVRLCQVPRSLDRSTGDKTHS